MRTDRVLYITTLSIALVLLAVLPLMAAPTPSNQPTMPNCLDCHTCRNPTPEDMCLKPCPTLQSAHNTKKAKHGLSEAPDTMRLDEIADLYQPVDFNHKLHAGMAQMGNNCGTCHHFSPEGKIPPCKECHMPSGEETNLRQPGLKGAYHRQCLGCHREWSHDTKCVVCHLPTEGKKLAEGVDKTDIMGISHPKTEAPRTKVYTTPYKQGPIVTFHHDEHVDLFGLRCVDCHQKENCIYCHDLAKTAASRKSMKEVHAVCSDNCHATDNCAKCHGTSEKKAFVHAVTGWPLNRFHERLGCRSCHPTGKKIAKLNNECTSCHQNWKPGAFKHVVVGLTLDDTHLELDCESCHIDRKFGVKPTCDSCHDDQRDFKKVPPGQYSSR